MVTIIDQNYSQMIVSKAINEIFRSFSWILKDYQVMRANLDKMLKRGKVFPINRANLETEFLKEDTIPDSSVKADNDKAERGDFAQVNINIGEDNKVDADDNEDQKENSKEEEKQKELKDTKGLWI
jgi:hypothetical protein